MVTAAAKAKFRHAPVSPLPRHGLDRTPFSLLEGLRPSHLPLAILNGA
jgi:hypothetical protein